MPDSSSPARYLSNDDFRNYVPVHVVWEITLACDLKCVHCGSRAGKKRPDELSTEDCIEVIDALARMGTREITLIGGEAYLRKDWLDLIAAVSAHGMNCSIQSGGRNLTPERLEAAAKAGLKGVGVSLDGLGPLHDRLRQVPGAFEKASESLRVAKSLGLGVSVNTQIGAETLPQMRPLMDHILDLGATHWQIQLTVAMGNAVDNPEVLLQPYRLAEVMPELAALYRDGSDRGLLLTMGNNIGYFGPYEALWRGFGDERVHWSGCGAGRTVVALEADGTVKGCPSLATDGFSGGSVRDAKIQDIWKSSPNIHFGRMRTTEDLWGFCKSCYYAEPCRAGCTWTSHSLFGKPGNNPYCHHRVLTLQQQGLRERIVKVQDAPDAAFAIGQFDLITERISDGAQVSSALHDEKDFSLRWTGYGEPSQGEGAVPIRLGICRACNHYVQPGESHCPFCDADLTATEATYQNERRDRLALISRLSSLLENAPRMD